MSLTFLLLPDQPERESIQIHFSFLVPVKYTFMTTKATRLSDFATHKPLIPAQILLPSYITDIFMKKSYFDSNEIEND